MVHGSWLVSVWLLVYTMFTVWSHRIYCGRKLLYDLWWNSEKVLGLEWFCGSSTVICISFIFLNPFELLCFPTRSLGAFDMSRFGLMCGINMCRLLMAHSFELWCILTWVCRSRILYLNAFWMLRWTNNRNRDECVQMNKRYERRCNKWTQLSFRVVNIVGHHGRLIL